MNKLAPASVNVCTVYPGLEVVLTVPPSPLCGPLYARIIIPDPPSPPAILVPDLKPAPPPPPPVFAVAAFPTKPR